MPNVVGGHSRRHGNRTVYIEPRPRMPRKREYLHPEDKRIYELEREIVTLQRMRQSLEEDAEDYAEFGYPELSARKLEEAEVYDRRIEEKIQEIQQIRHLQALEGVGD